MSDIGPIHQIAYDHGHDPVEYAVGLVTNHLAVRDAVAAGQVAHGVPITLLDQSTEAYARRVLGQLLDAGWTPPATPGPDAH